MAKKSKTVNKNSDNNSEEQSSDVVEVEVKKLISKGKEKGYLTYTELEKVLNPQKLSIEKIEDIQAMINMGGYYSGTASAYFGSMRCIATDAGARHGRLEFLTRDNTAFNTGLTIDHQPCVGIGTTTPVAKLDVIGHSPSTAPSVYDYLYANGSGIRVHGEEAGIDLVGLDDGGHSASVLLRNTNQGFGIFNVPNDDTLRIRSFDAQAQNFLFFEYLLKCAHV